MSFTRLPELDRSVHNRPASRPWREAGERRGRCRRVKPKKRRCSMARTHRLLPIARPRRKMTAIGVTAVAGSRLITLSSRLAFISRATL